MTDADIYRPAIEAVAPSASKIFRHLLAGAYARVDVAERRADNAEHRLAELLAAAKWALRDLTNYIDPVSDVTLALEAAIAHAVEPTP